MPKHLIVSVFTGEDVWKETEPGTPIEDPESATVLIALTGLVVVAVIAQAVLWFPRSMRDDWHVGTAGDAAAGQLATRLIHTLVTE